MSDILLIGFILFEVQVVLWLAASIEPSVSEPPEPPIVPAKLLQESLEPPSYWFLTGKIKQSFTRR